MKRQKQLITNGKGIGILLICAMLFLAAVPGCAAVRGKSKPAAEKEAAENVKEAGKAETAKNAGKKKVSAKETGKAEAEGVNGGQDMKNTEGKVSGFIAVTTREEQEAADRTAQTLFGALEAGDEAAIRGLFSPYALENAEQLEEKIRELLAYYPGADGGYQGVSISREHKDGSRYRHILNLTLTVKDKGQKYQINICLYMRDDFEPAREGVHLIEVIREEEKPADFKWKEEKDAPGVYVAE